MSDQQNINITENQPANFDSFLSEFMKKLIIEKDLKINKNNDSANDNEHTNNKQYEDNDKNDDGEDDEDDEDGDDDEDGEDEDGENEDDKYNKKNNNLKLIKWKSLNKIIDSHIKLLNIYKTMIDDDNIESLM